MKSFRVFNRQSGSVAALAGLLVATVAPAVVPALAFAAQVTERSVELSSSSVSAPGVTYKVSFTAIQSAGSFVVDFCSNSPLIGSTCTAPVGMNAGTVTTPTPSTTVTGATSKLVVTKAIAANDDVVVEVAGITNPSASGSLYARILTYTDTAAAGYVSATSIGSPQDTGSVALYITPTVGVSAAVLETMTFCVAKNAISDNCNLTGNEAPVLALGEDTGGVKALSATAVSTGTIHAQLSTNAAHGAIVNLKSNATGCGGLLLAGGSAGNCFIAPALNSDIQIGDAAKFGVKLANLADGANGNGDISPAGNYNASTYALNYVDDTNGVTSTYGDPFFTTEDLPVNNKNVELTFGATITNQTPAGKYSADLSLIATGKF